MIKKSYNMPSQVCPIYSPIDTHEVKIKFIKKTWTKRNLNITQKSYHKPELIIIVIVIVMIIIIMIIVLAFLPFQRLVAKFVIAHFP